MMMQQLELNVLAAPLAAMDPRSLSQAWYSALRLAHPQECRALSPGKKSTSDSSSRVERFSRGDTQALPFRSAESRPTRSELPKPPLGVVQQGVTRVADRRVFPLSERIERRFAQSRTPVSRATFSMGRGAARVFVIAQTNGNVATLIALCRPEMRALVARALASARFRLTTHGFVIDLQTAPRRCS
jgi:hypothetical protein